MGEKKELVQAVLDELPEVLDAYLPKYLKKHRTELKRWLLNTDGFRSEEEFEAVEKESEACKAEMMDLRALVERLQAECTTRGRALVDAKDMMRQCIEERDAMRVKTEKMQQAFEELRSECARLSETYGRAEDVVVRYHAIPTVAREGLAPILGNSGDGLTLVVRLAKLENFQSLWDYAATLLVRDELGADEAKALTALVDDSLALVNASHATPLLDIQDVALGTRYLPTTMQKTSASRQQGTVSRVLLRGCAYAGSGNCLRKPLVVVE